MSLRDVFNYDEKKNPDGYRAEKVNDNVLFTSFSRSGSRQQYTYYDFLSRTVAVLVSGSNHDRTLTFDEMDREVLELHRDALIELGGNPRPLPEKQPAAPSAHRPFRA